MEITYHLLTIKGEIHEGTLDKVIEVLPVDDTQLLFIGIDTFGGDPSIGYRIMRMLHSRYETIIALVPNVAYSTGTLMALGADTIYMHEGASLGPLDMQIQHPTAGGQISSLEIRDTLNTLSGSSLSYAEGYYRRLRTRMQIGKVQAAKIAFKASQDIVKPIIEKIDPIYLQMSMRTSKVGQSYATKLLTARMMKDAPAVAGQVSSVLANEYDYHGYAIMYDEARDDLMLSVDLLANLSVWESDLKANFNADKDGVTFHHATLTVPDDTAEDGTDANDTSASNNGGVDSTTGTGVTEVDGSAGEDASDGTTSVSALSKHTTRAKIKRGGKRRR